MRYLWRYQNTLKKFDGFIALGCVVIRGQTSHYDFICNSSINSIIDISVNTKPIGNGIIMANDIHQAKKRKVKKGTEAAKAVIGILSNERHKSEISPRVRVIQKIYGSLFNPDEIINYPKANIKFIKDVVEGTLERRELIEEKIIEHLKDDINLKNTDKLLKIICCCSF